MRSPLVTTTVRPVRSATASEAAIRLNDMADGAVL